MKKILVILGTRPEAVKLAPLILELRRHPDQFESKVGLTGQHTAMAEEALKVFGLTPDLGIRSDQTTKTLCALNAHMLLASEMLIQKTAPDLVVVQGDTASALGGASAAFYSRIPVAHVEAGLRSGSLESPFPEEFNRVTITRIAKWHFAPTPAARDNLVAEGVEPDNILLSGNTGIDALHFALDALRKSNMKPDGSVSALKRLRDKGIKLVVVTLHRRENLVHLEKICRALRRLAEQYSSLHLAFVVHPNPEVQRPVESILGDHPGITLCPPLGYFDLLALLDHSSLIITDSGGIQEEAPTLGKPVVVVRSHTERKELLEGHAALLCDPVKDNLETMAINALKMKASPALVNPFGDGQACERIVEFLSRLPGK